jgi:hypothetical protein
MAKSSKFKTTQPPPSPASTATITTVADLRKDAALWYKILLLIYDLKNYGSKNPASKKRLDETTHVRHLSGPYFSEKEAELVQSAVCPSEGHSLMNEENDNDDAEENSTEATAAGDGDATDETFTLDQAITHRLRNFLEKRRPSGDARPCGKHDMVPIYLECFGAKKEEIEGEGFVRRAVKYGLRG